MRKNLGNIAKILFGTVIFFGCVAASWIGIDGIMRNQVYQAGTRGLISAGIDTTGSDTTRFVLVDGNGNLYVRGSIDSLAIVGAVLSLPINETAWDSMASYFAQVFNSTSKDTTLKVKDYSIWYETIGYTDTLTTTNSTVTDTIPGSSSYHFPINKFVIQTSQAVKVMWFDVDGDSSTFYLNAEDDWNWPPDGYVQYDSVRITKLSVDARIRRIYMSRETEK